jgi:hypothetical protein
MEVLKVLLASDCSVDVGPLVDRVLLITDTFLSKLESSRSGSGSVDSTVFDEFTVPQEFTDTVLGSKAMEIDGLG